MSPITLALADDHQVVREGLRALLEAEEDFTVVGEAGDGLAVLELVGALAPDVLVVDVVMPGLNGLDVIRQLGQRAPRTRVVVLSMYGDEGYVLEALRHGAAGYVLKGASGSDLVQAVRQVAAGRRYLSPPLSERAVAAYLERSLLAATADTYETLTARERQVLQLAGEGRSNAQVAARLAISVRTVETHRANLMRKLGLRGQADLVRYVVGRGRPSGGPSPSGLE